MTPDTLSRRQRAVRSFMSTLGGRESVDIEAAIVAHVVSSKTPCDYEAKVRQLVWNLRKTPSLRSHPPATLVLLTDKTMAEGTDVERWTTDFEMELEKEDRLVNSKHTQAASLLKCSRCKSDSISTNQVQTRGADEAMTVFCACDNCNLRWTM